MYHKLLKDSGWALRQRPINLIRLRSNGPGVAAPAWSVMSQMFGLGSTKTRSRTSNGQIQKNPNLINFQNWAIHNTISKSYFQTTIPSFQKLQNRLWTLCAKVMIINPISFSNRFVRLIITAASASHRRFRHQYSSLARTWILRRNRKFITSALRLRNWIRNEMECRIVAWTTHACVKNGYRNKIEAITYR